MKKLDVCLTGAPGEKQLVGQLAESDRRVYFEYASSFLEAPLWLSPFKLPPQPGLHEHRDRQFGPLFGLFDDSLPDGWGLLLMDRHFSRLEIDPAAVSPLDRLAYLGDRTMGALTYHPPLHEEDLDHQVLDLHDMAQAAYTVLSGSSGDVLPQLLRTGGSPGGARPKVLVGRCGDQMISGEDELPEGFTHWLVKFYAREDARDDGCIEYAYAQMAQAAGVRMPAVDLLTTPQGERFFGIARFDRKGNRRTHVHTFGNLIHANFRIPGCDYETLLKVTRILTKNQADVEAVFRQMVFNVLAHNRDDHVKNFAFILRPEDGWACSPAYDLTFAPGPGGEHTMTLAGEGKTPGRRQFSQLASGADIQDATARDIIDSVATAVSNWSRFSASAGVGKKSSAMIQAKIQGCLGRI